MQDLRGTLFNITKNVTKTSGDLLKTTKLNLSLSNEEANLKNLYMEIGKKVHEIYLYGGSLGKFFDEKYKELSSLEMKISDIKEQIGVIKGTRECAKCGKPVERTAEFCPKCGHRQEFAAAAGDMQGGHSGHMPYGAPVGGHHEVAHSDGYVPAPAAYPPPPAMEAAAAGISAPIVETSPEPPALPPAPPPAAVKICRICKSENEQTAKFCLSCGRILD